jgi:hypothetical protein
MSNFFAEQGRTRGYNEAYFSYVEEVTLRRTPLSGKMAIFGWKLIRPIGEWIEIARQSIYPTDALDLPEKTAR